MPLCRCAALAAGQQHLRDMALLVPRAVLLLFLSGTAVDVLPARASQVLQGRVKTDDGGPDKQQASSVAPRKLTPAEIAPHPPMQWHSWGLFTHEDLVTEVNMAEMAEALV
eukprot:SAG11_NODE_4031_length_2098_cov_1.247624_1_plen_110_part_10